MRAVVDDFAGAVRAELEAARAEGLGFAAAWDRTMARVQPREREWGALQDVVGGAEHESPMTFLYRHMRAGFVGRRGARYCPADCVSLEPCLRHGGPARRFTTHHTLDADVMHRTGPRGDST